MSDLGLYRAFAGGVGLAGCIALLVDQARANAIELAQPAPLTLAAEAAPVAPGVYGLGVPGDAAQVAPARRGSVGRL
ncbi:MAG: hypothetical protein ABI626_04245 [Sphingomicrobium sp.]